MSANIKNAVAVALVTSMIEMANEARASQVKKEEKTPSKADARQAAIQKLFNTKTKSGEPVFGCNHNDVVKLVASITGFELTPHSDSNAGIWIQPFQMVVSLENYQSKHQHKLRTCLCVARNGDGYCMSERVFDAGDTSTCYDRLAVAWVRPATDEEFKAFTEKMKAEPERVYNWLNATIGMGYLLPNE